ncbi:MAG: LamG domain-containing protein, partial [Phycisphaerales bacterium]
VGDIQWADGYQGMALEFAGGSASNPTYVDFGQASSLQLTGSITISAWVKMNPGNAGAYMGIGGKLISGQYKGFALVRHSSNVFRLWCDDGAGVLDGHEASSDVAYTDTKWHHVVGVVDEVISSLYVDGVKQVQQGVVNLTDSGGIAYIGKQYGDDSSHRYWNGLIDDVRIYSKALTDAEIADVMLGDAKLAGDPIPGRDALLDIRDVSSLSWSRGSTAASHDVYFGTDRDAVASADNSAPQFKGNQTPTSLSLASLVEFGGGDYYWRIDEVEAGGTVHAGTIWKFTVPDYLIVDDFESYNDIDEGQPGSNRIYLTWIDGYGTTTNGSQAGNLDPPFMSQGHSGAQAMPLSYDNAGKTSEATRTLTTKKDWTEQGVTKLVIWFSGASGNAAERMFVALGNATVYHPDDAATQDGGWNEWVIDLQEFANQGTDLTNVGSITLGFGTRGAPVPTGGTGTVHFDDIRLVR